MLQTFDWFCQFLVSLSLINDISHQFFVLFFAYVLHDAHPASIQLTFVYKTWSIEEAFINFGNWTGSVACFTWIESVLMDSSILLIGILKL